MKRKRRQKHKVVRMELKKKGKNSAALPKAIENYLHRVYYDPKHAGSYSGLDKIYRVIKHEGKYDVNKTKLKEWLQKQDVYTLFKSVNHKFRRGRVIVNGIDQQFDVDLADMAKLSRSNDNYKYLLVVIDILSRMVWVRPVRSKHGPVIAKAFTDIFKTTGRIARNLRSDSGLEFRNQFVKNVFDTFNINHFLTNNEDIKANYAESFIKTLKNNMVSKNTRRYIDNLQDIVDSYNNTIHSKIKIKPAEVTRRNQLKVWRQMYSDIKKRPIKFNFKVGDKVRLAFTKKPFDRSFSQKFTNEIFRIKKRIRRRPPVYEIEDLQGEPITGTVYESEITKVDKNDNDVHKIEKIIGRKLINNKLHFLVKWLNLPVKFNSYVPATEIKDIYNGVNVELNSMLVLLEA